MGFRRIFPVKTSKTIHRIKINIFDHIKANLVYNTINERTPLYLQQMFSPRENVYNLRDSQSKLFIPKPRTDYMKRSFSYSGAFLWNSLPESLRSIDNFSHFKTGLKHYLNNNRCDSHTAIR